MNADISNMNVNSSFTGQNYDLQKNFILPGYNVGLNYQFSQNKRLNLYHYSDFTIPTAEQLTPYRDISNPLVAFQEIGSENTWSNSTYLYFNNFNMVKLSAITLILDLLIRTMISSITLHSMKAEGS